MDGAGLSFEAEVTEIVLASQAGAESLWKIALDHTEFSAGDSGRLVATSASGVELDVQVVRVETDSAGTTWHMARKPLMAGTRVRGEVAAHG